MRSNNQSRRRRIDAEDIGDVTVVNFVDRKLLDDRVTQIVGKQVIRLVDEVGRRKLLLNFHDVEYVSSTALGMLITLQKKVQAAGGKLVLCEIDPQIYEVFEITKLDRFFDIAGTEAEGLIAFEGFRPKPASGRERWPGEIAESAQLCEGAVRQVLVNAYERNPKARAACIKHYGVNCVICGFDFGAFYGDEVKGFIHVHHLKQISTVGKEYRVDPIKHLLPICPNCHAVVHLNGKTRSIKTVKAMVNASRRK
jgi:anti-anti-sigma factor